MQRCSNCGRTNRDGSLFCQECGNRLEEAGRAVQPAAAIQCPACGASNTPGTNFCRMCGTQMVQAAYRPAAAPAPVEEATVVQAAAATPSGPAAIAPTAAKTSCPTCNKLTPSGFAFCQHCGSRFPAANTGPNAVLGAPVTVEPESSVVVAPRVLTPPAGPAPVGYAGGANVARPATSVVSAPIRVPNTAPRAILTSEVSAAVHGRLIVLRRDGSDGDVHLITGISFDIGRLEGDLTFADDPYLAPRHARISWIDNVLRVRALDTVNGVFLRLREPHELQPGDHILLGQELLRFEPIAPEEREPPSLVEHGVRLLGSAPRDAWGRLRELTAAGTTRSMWYLTRPELTLGREEGDLVFPDDEFMSHRHAVLQRGAGPGRAHLEDLGSSNGTFVRLRAQHELQDGDVLRMGDLLLRYER